MNRCVTHLTRIFNQNIQFVSVLLNGSGTFRTDQQDAKIKKY